MDSDTGLNMDNEIETEAETMREIYQIQTKIADRKIYFGWFSRVKINVPELVDLNGFSPLASMYAAASKVSLDSCWPKLPPFR